MKKKFVLVVAVIVVLVGVWGVWRPLPEGIDFQGEEHLVDQKGVHFLSDLTYVDDGGKQIGRAHV